MSTGLLGNGPLALTSDWEKWESRESDRDRDQRRHVRIYTVPVDDPEEAETYGPSIGASYNGMEVENKHGERIAENVCLLTIEYLYDAGADSGGQSEGGINLDRSNGTTHKSFDTSAQTEHIERAVNGQTKYEGGCNDPLVVGDLIGVVDKDTIEGTDRYFPAFNWEITKYWSDADMTDAYMNTLYRLTATVNSNPFYMFDEKEALFLGAVGRQVKTNKWEVTYRFAGQRTTFHSIDLCGTATGITKQGWDYLWFRKKPEYDPATRQVSIKVISVYVMQTYDSRDFALLDIGG